MKIAIIAKARNGPMIAYRQQFKLNQTNAAKLAGVGLPTWLDLESMRFNKVSVKSIDKIAMALNVHPNVVAPPEIRGKHLQWAETAFTDIDSRYLLNHIGNSQLLSHEVDVRSVGDAVDAEDMKDKISEILMTLTYREREVIKLLFGIKGTYQHTLKDVAGIFKVSTDRVRQVRDKAIRKLQHPVRAGKIEKFLEAPPKDALIAHKARNCGWRREAKKARTAKLQRETRKRRRAKKKSPLTFIPHNGTLPL